MSYVIFQCTLKTMVFILRVIKMIKFLYLKNSLFKKFYNLNNIFSTKWANFQTRRTTHATNHVPTIDKNTFNNIFHTNFTNIFVV